jgi:hypothetical protein
MARAKASAQNRATMHSQKRCVSLTKKDEILEEEQAVRNSVRSIKP